MNCTMDELLEAQAHVWNLLFGYLKSMTLKSAAELGIADVLYKRGKPMSISDLSSALSIPPEKLGSFRRIMRVLVHLDIFAAANSHPGLDHHDDVLYVLTPTSRLLVSTEPKSVRPFLRLVADPIISEPTHLLGSWLQSPAADPFVLFHGKGVFELADEKPEFNQVFNEAMASDSRLVVEVVLGHCAHVFDGLKSLVDVGGGTGTTIRAIAKAFPTVKCTLFDLPHVINTLEATREVDYVSGDFFVSVPKANAVMLKWILHDWNDEECVKILKRCKEAVPSKENGGKIIIIDMVVGATADEHSAAVETQLMFDLLMMVLLTGEERTEKEWKKLFLAAGITEYKITPLVGLRSIIELYP